MFISNYNGKKFTVKFKEIDIDIFDYEAVIDICEKIIRKIICKNKDYGIYIFDIYTNYEYGMIIDVVKLSDDSEDIDIKIKFHIDSIFLQEVDIFDCNNCNVYYYDKNFYVEYNKNDYIDSYILYGDLVYDILNKAIIIKI